ncbi:hypothetical protein D9615_004039 [Tricholomella constricta]|uniref:Uncharacterized protein n=1 Tax=Tricholomella constricta TaxID=117010 RepID=A0A8H5HD05_9AGAR|nr:hypothetical protein D9615_004039 [Tricholomella constricta]
MSPLNPLRTSASLTPSLVSDTPSGGTSPSKVASSRSRFKAWMERAKVMIAIDPTEEVINLFDSFFQLEEVPSGLIYDPLPTPTWDEEADFQAAIRAWASRLRPVDLDNYGILSELHTLALAYSRIRKTSNNRSKEHSQRRGIDDILEMALSARADCHTDFRTEESYRLAGLDGNPDAVSDTLVTISSAKIADEISSCSFTFTNRSVADHLYWSTIGVTDIFSIIGFAGEFKKEDAECNKNQLIMVLTTAQSQRKALGFKKSIIMGATSCRGCVQIYSSYWSPDNAVIHIYEHAQQFNLTDPVQVIRLYVFCSKLGKYIQELFATDLQDWTSPAETTLQNHRWRSPDRKRRLSESEGSTGTDVRTRRRSNGPSDADAAGTDQFSEVMKWRNEVIKDMQGQVFGYGQIAI